MKITPRLLLLATLLVPSGLAQTAALASSQAADRDSRKIEEERDRPQGRAALTVKVNQVRLDATVRDPQRQPDPRAPARALRRL